MKLVALLAHVICTGEQANFDVFFDLCTYRFGNEMRIPDFIVCHPKQQSIGMCGREE